MGFGIAGIVGAAVSGSHKHYVLVTGDGGIQMNLQELQTVNHNKLAVKILLLNNSGYHAIKSMQDNLFPGNAIGCHPESGVSNPDFRLIAQAYNLPYSRIESQEQLVKELPALLAADGACFCELIMQKDQLLLPRAQSHLDENGHIVSAKLESLKYYP